jgi:hypothetical protein
MTHRNLVPQYHVLLDINTLDDAQLHTVAGDIGGASTTSVLVLNYAEMQTTVATVGTKDVALTKASKQVDIDRNNLRLSIASEALARAELRRSIRTFATQATEHAKSPAEIQGAGLHPRPPVTQTTQVPDAPASLIEKPPKRGHGKTTVVAEDPGPTRHAFVAEQSTDGVTFSQLGVGHGKTREVTGPSGTKVWVRFAIVHRGAQSPWSTVLLVTIP